jgi:hypothetical protein
MQADLLAAIIAGPLISVDDLMAAAVLPVPSEARKVRKSQVADKTDGALW